MASRSRYRHIERSARFDRCVCAARPGPARQPASGSACTGTGSENPAVATVTGKKQPAAGLGVQTTAGWMSCAISFRPQGKLEAR